MSGLIDWIGQHMEQLTNGLLFLMALAAAFGLGVSVASWEEHKNHNNDTMVDRH